MSKLQDKDHMRWMSLAACITAYDSYQIGEYIGQNIKGAEKQTPTQVRARVLLHLQDTLDELLYFHQTGEEKPKPQLEAKLD